jgi:methyl-accepting chemotaxis protein
LIHRSSEIVSGSPFIYDKQFEELQQIQEKLHLLNQRIPAHVKSCAAMATQEGEPEKWEIFLDTWNKWYTHDQDFFQNLEKVLANPSPQLVAEFHRHIAKGNTERLELTVKLNEIAFELTESNLLAANAWSQKMRDYILHAATVATLALTLLFIILVLLYQLFLFPKRFGKLRAFLKRHIGDKGTEADEVVEVFSRILDNLRKMLSSIQAKIQNVNSIVETLTRGMQQIVTDQSNLFSLHTAIESARPQDGFTQASGEIGSLAEHTQRLSADMRDMSRQLQVFVNETMAELEQIANQIELNQTPSLDLNSHLHTIREDVENFSKPVSQISDALQIDPVQTMVSLKRDETG